MKDKKKTNSKKVGNVIEQTQAPTGSFKAPELRFFNQAAKLNKETKNEIQLTAS